MNHPTFPAHPAAGPRRPLRPASQLLPLEQRFMFDGAVADAAHAAQAHDSAPPVPPAVTVRAAEPAKDEGKKEVVLVDTSLANYKSLEAGVRDGVGIVEFDGSRDGLAQIAQWAAGQSGLDAIHILSHGSEGTLNLGTARLTEASLASPATQAELARLGQALGADGDLLLYGCDGGDSAALLSGIAKATGADVAASTDLTGAARLGGNWTLEARQGVIDTRELALTQYNGVLETVNFNYGVDADENGGDLDGDGSASTITKTVGGKTFVFSGDELYDYGFGLYPLASDHNSVVLTVTVQTGYIFDLNSVVMASDAIGPETLTISFLRADGSSGSVTYSPPNDAVPRSYAPALTGLKSVTFHTDNTAYYSSLNITNVTAAPPAAVANNAALSSDTAPNGMTNTDFITSVAAQTISGTLSANLDAGAKVEVSYDNGGNWNDATSYTAGSKAWSTTTTLAGSNTFQVRVTGANGASSTAYTHSYTLDTTAPTASFTGISLSADTGFSSTDFVTKTAAQTIGATLGGAPAGTDTVWGSLDGGTSWTNITSKVSGTTLSWNGATLGAGGSSIMLKVSDAAGNDSSLSFQNYTLDTTAPTRTVDTVAFSNDSGTSQTDFVTNMASQTVSGTLSGAMVAGDAVYVSLDNGSTWAAATTTVGQSAWSLAGRTLTASSTLKVKVSDTAGNDSTVLSQAYTYDTTAPTITFNSLALSADTGTAGDFITKTAAQTVTATLSTTLAGGDIVYGSLDNGGSWTDITSKVSGTALSWNGVTLAGSGTLQLKIVDAAGNSGTAKTQAYVLDTTAPATPGTPVLASASDTGALNNDRITTDTTPTLSGTAENGSTVTLFDGATLIGTVTAGAGGWTYTTGVLAEGSHTITAVATDTAGNASAASAGLSIDIDTTAPAVASVAVPANGTYYSGDTLAFTVNFGEAVVVDTLGGTPRIALVVGATTRYANYVSGSGTSALTFSYIVPSGDIDANGVTVGALSANGGTLRDTAGNDAVVTLNSVGSTAAVNVDGTNPSITGVGASTADGAYGSGQTITITVDFSTAVDVDTTGGTPTLALDSGGTATYTGGSGSSTLTFSYTVGAGHNSADLDYSSSSALALNGATIVDAGGAHQAAAVTLATPGTAGSLGANQDLVIDTAAPANTVDGAAFSADTGTSGTDFITKTAAQTVSGTLASNLAADEHVYVSLDNGSSWALATASAGSNTWSLAGQTLTGSGTLKVRVSDDAGNNGTAYSQAYVLDTTAPTISFSGVALSADTGASSTDLITNTAAQTISATLSGAPAAGDIVYGSLDNGATWTDVTSKVSGTTLTWNGVTLAASNTLQLRVTDAAGNNGGATSKAYVLDTSGPATSVATAAFSADSGTSNTDFITRTAAQTVSGTLSANLAAGESVLVSLDNGATWATAAITVGSDSWTLAGQTLSASDTLLVKVADTAGNDGTVLSQAYVFDTAASVPTVDTQTTMSLTPVLTGTATLAAGETMTVTVGGATYDVVPVAGAWSLDLASAVPSSGALALVLNNQYSVVATVTDLAGNTASDAGSNELTVGSVAAPAPTTGVTGAALSADSGASGSDGVTNVAAQTISGGLSAPLVAGETVEVSVDGGATWQSADVNGRNWSLAGVTLAEGENQVLAKVSSVNGDGPGYAGTYVLDTTAPLAPTAAVQTAATATPVLTGTATLAAGDTLSVSVGGATYEVSVSRGAWSLDLATATPATGTLALLPGARYDVTATVTDLAGNIKNDSGSGELLIAGAPTTLVTGAALSADSGDSNSDFITNVAAQTVSGSLSAPLASGQRVEISLDGGASWSIASAATGSTAWSASITLSGSNTFVARVSSDAGNGPASQHAYTLDTTAPLAAPTSAVLAPSGTLSGGLTAPLGAGEAVLVSRDGGNSWQQAAVSGGGWSSAGAAASTVLVVVRDAAGNSGSVLTVDAATQVPPVPPVQQVPVVVTPPAPADSGPGDAAPVDAAPAEGGGTPAAPGAVGPDSGLPPILSPTAPSSVLIGVPAPDAPSNPLAPPSIATLTDSSALLSVFTPSGLPEPAFAGDALVVNQPIADLTIGSGERILVQLGADTFASTSGSTAGIELSAQSADGTPLPGWLKFDGKAARFEGTPPPGFEGTLSFKVTARDANGKIAVQVFKIVVTKDGAAAPDAKGAPVKSSSLDLHIVDPVGRSGLNEQLRAALGTRTGAGADRLALLARSAAAAREAA